MKKILTFVLAVSLLIGMSTTAFSAQKIDKYQSGGDLFVEKAWSSYATNSGPDGYAATADSDISIEVTDIDDEDERLSPDADKEERTVKVFFNPAAFLWKGSDNDSWDGETGLTASMLTSDIKMKLSLDNASSKEQTIIKSYSIEQEKFILNKSGSGKENMACVEVVFTDKFNSVDEVEFDFDVVVKINGVKRGTINFTGIFGNTEETIEGDQDEIDASEGIVMSPEEMVRNIVVYGGNELYATVNMSPNKNYRFYTHTEITDDDFEVMEKFEEISNIIYVNQVNMKMTGDRYAFHGLDDEFYVYNEDGKLIGTTDEELPFSNKYYLATSKISMSGGSSSKNDDEDEDEDPYIPPAPPDIPELPELPGIGSGSNDNYPIVNYNPNTGANSTGNLAAVAGLVALAAAGALAAKKK